MKSKGVLLILSCLLVTSLFFLFVGEPSSSSSSSSTTSSSSSSAAASVASSTSDGGWVALPLRRSKQVVTSSSDSSSSFEEGKNHQEPSSYSNHFHPNDVPRHVEDWSNRIQGEKRELNSQQEIEEELSSPGEEDAVVNRALESLGFTSAPRTYPRVWTNISLPVVVTAVTSQMEDEEISKFLRRFHDSFPNFLLIIYTVSLDEKEFDSVSAEYTTFTIAILPILPILFSSFMTAYFSSFALSFSSLDFLVINVHVFTTPIQSPNPFVSFSLEISCCLFSFSAIFYPRGRRRLCVSFLILLFRLPLLFSSFLAG